MQEHTSHIHNIIASSTATSLAELITIPICTVKTNYQTNYQIKSHGIIQTIKNIHQRRGVSGFYSASAFAMSAQVVSTTGKYTLYRAGTSYDIPRIPASILSGLIVSSMTHPIDFLRICHQRKESIDYSKAPRIFYRGYSKGLLKVIVGSSLFLPVYDFSKERIGNPFLASLTSSVISTILIQPFDYIKTRSVAGVPWYQGMNPIVYFRGCSLNLLRIVPHFTIVMTVTEMILKRID